VTAIVLALIMLSVQIIIISLSISSTLV